MPRVLKFKSIVKALNNLGYFKDRQKGSHIIFKNNKGEITVVPKHSNGEIPAGLVGKICRDIKVDYKDFEKLI